MRHYVVFHFRSHSCYRCQKCNQYVIHLYQLYSRQLNFLHPVHSAGFQNEILEPLCYYIHSLPGRLKLSLLTEMWGN